MSKNGWNSGPPPSIGWWPASNDRHPRALRWWNGRKWSAAAFSERGASEAEIMARWIDKQQSRIEWRERPAAWPARSRT